MEQIPLTVTRREGAGKEAARKLRAAGIIPAVIYGSGREAESLSVALGDLEKAMREVVGITAFLSLVVDDEEPRMAVIREIQKDYLGTNPVHVDFYEIKADQTLTIDVPLDFLGTPLGAEEGGLLDIQNHSVAIEGTVATIPERLEIDVSELNIGDTLHASELVLPGNVTLITDTGIVLVSCYIPAVIEEPEEEIEEGEEVEGEEGAEGEEGEGEDKGEESAPEGD